MRLKFVTLVTATLLLAGCSPQQLVQNRVERSIDQAMSQATDALQEARNAPRPTSLRVATYNVSMYSDEAGGVRKRLQNNDPDYRKIAAVIQDVRPDVVLLNEFDEDWAAAELFRKEYLTRAQHGQLPIDYPYAYVGAVNTGVQSGLDLDNNGTVGGTGRDKGNDAWGYGQHPGQYGMLILSKYPIGSTRTFQRLPWSSMPGALRPTDPTTGRSWYSDAVWSQLRLSSKSHWDVTINVNGKPFHLLASHPTPPVFDGPEKRNRNRNHDEIRLWKEFLTNDPSTRSWLCDDQKSCGGLPLDAAWILVGDQNADPVDGDGVPGAINQILLHPRAQIGNAPRSFGGPLRAAEYGMRRTGDVATHTGDFGPKSGTLRLDYVVPSKQFRIVNQGVFWPAPSDSAASYANASDHHMVWMDLQY